MLVYTCAYPNFVSSPLILTIQTEIILRMGNFLSLIFSSIPNFLMLIACATLKGCEMGSGNEMLYCPESTYMYMYIIHV